MRRVTLVAVLALLGLSVVVRSGRTAHSTSLPNVVLILTDDQRSGTLWTMPNVAQEITAQGVTFSNYFDPDSECCPARASILSGQYAHTNGVYRNNPPNGGFASFRDATTIATRLHTAGYRTALIGKYLNGYTSGRYIPPGWDRWYAFTSPGYYSWKISDQGTIKSETTYSTDTLTDQAISFINSTPRGRPLFLDLAIFAPHGEGKRKPPVPRKDDDGKYDGIAPSRPPSFNEADVSDKPPFIQSVPLWDSRQIASDDLFRQKQLESLISVDRDVDILMTALSDAGRLANTIVVFASDNGYLWGEHRWRGKNVTYEESIRLPLIIRYDPLTQAVAGSTNSSLVVNIDLTRTFADLAGASTDGMEGLSLVPLLGQRPTPWRDAFVLEHLAQSAPTYCGARDEQFAYTQYQDGFEELYDLDADPYELQNVASDASYATDLDHMRTLAHTLCSPVPPGFTWKH